MAIVRIGNTPDLLVGTGANGTLEAKTAEAAREALGAQRALSVEIFQWTVDTALFAAANSVGYKFGNVVVLGLELKSMGAASGWTQIGTIPSGYYPIARIFCCVAFGSRSAPLYIDKDGTILSYGVPATGDWIYGQVVYMTA